MTETATFVIRRATAADAAGILECLAEAFELYRSSYTREAFQDTVLTPETLEERLKSMAIFVGISPQGLVIGTVAACVVSGEEGHLRGMAVRNRWQGEGLAEQLLVRAESELQASGCRRITLDTTAPLQRAMRFYERHGYEPSGRTQDFFGMPLFEYVKDVGRPSAAIR